MIGDDSLKRDPCGVMTVVLALAIVIGFMVWSVIHKGIVVLREIIK